MTDFRLETDRLVLRNWRPGEMVRFAEVTNTPEVMRWLGGVMDSERLAAFEERVLRLHEAHGHTFWVVERKPDGGDLSGEMLGFCGLKKIDAPGASFLGAFEIGWRLRSDAHGKGYAREAATVSLDAGFDRFDAEEIFAITVIENEPSWGLMRRLGMQRRQELDYDDLRFEPPLRHTIVYSIKREAWAEQPR